MRFGPFEIERPLGRGGMAETFVARFRTAQGFERTVCLKRILAEHAASPEFVRAFQEEAKLAMRLVHPHIAQLYDFGEIEGAWWMSLELVGGGDLRSFLKGLGQPLPLDLALLLAIDLASALEYAHGLVVEGRPANLVHRDVSPSNVLIDEQGNFKLVDFGIAKSSLSSNDTTTGKIKGKASYMAPEQGHGRKLDRRADLWALGVVLFEALAGERPFEAATDLATILLVIEGRRKTLKELAPHVPDDVCAIVERLLSVDPEARFQHASEVLEALEQRPPPPTARRRLAQIVRTIQQGETRAEAPPPASASPAAPTSTLAITSLALGATDHEPVPAAPDDVTRTRTVFDHALDRSIAQGAFEPTARHDSLAPRAPSPPVAAVAPSVVVSPEMSPQRLEATETRRAFGRPSWPLLALGVAGLGLLVGAIVAAFVVARMGSGTRVSTDAPPTTALVAPEASATLDASMPDAFVLDASMPDASVPIDVGLDAWALDANDRDANDRDANDRDANDRDANDRDANDRDANDRDANDRDANDRDAAVAAASSSTTPSSAGASEHEASAARAPREGRIEVVVVPWGRVEIDGEDVGRSPYRGTLRTGPHRVVGVAGEQRRTRTVRVTGQGVTRVSIAIE